MLTALQRHQWAFLVGALVLGMLTLMLPGLLDGPGPAQLQFRSESELPEGTPIRVHVAGAVVAPGVYHLRAGDRVIDALTLAGGSGGDADALNLARRLRDGEQIVVPARGGAAVTRQPVALAATGPLDINTATQAQLDQLPGIGEAYSRRIVDSRLVSGRFQSTEELVSRRVLPRATYERIRDLIRAGP